MQDTQLTIISNFLWAVSDAVLRDLYTRGKYRDVILPMTVLRRLDAVLEPSKQKVLAEKQLLDATGVTDQDDALQLAAGHTFYNTSPFTLRDVAARTSQKSIRADFDTYLDGYSPNVQDILEKFDFPPRTEPTHGKQHTRRPDQQVHVSRHQPQPVPS